MTVIAYDGRTLAADRRRLASDSDVLCEAGVKVAIGKGGAIATTGSAMSGETKARVISDLVAGKTDGLDDRVTGLALLDDGTAWLVNNGGALQITRPHAMGSGHEAARAAMIIGADARRAVEVASELLVTCGDGVDVYEPGKAA